MPTRALNAPWTVAGELGHGSTEMVNRVYDQLGEIRHRAEVVEYRIADWEHWDAVRKRLRHLQAA